MRKYLVVFTGIALLSLSVPAPSVSAASYEEAAAKCQQAQRLLQRLQTQNRQIEGSLDLVYSMFDYVAQRIEMAEKPHLKAKLDEARSIYAFLKSANRTAAFQITNAGFPIKLAEDDMRSGKYESAISKCEKAIADLTKLAKEQDAREAKVYEIQYLLSDIIFECTFGISPSESIGEKSTYQMSYVDNLLYR